MDLETVSLNRSHGGVQGVYRHTSRETKTPMTFSVYVPAHQAGVRLPVVWYLSGLTCTHANVTEKGEFRKTCAELGLVFVAPDTSPRGEGVPGDSAGGYDFGLGAGFYVDATEQPFAHNYRMWSYVTEELRELVAGQFPVDPKRQSIFGHSMGGHGALTIALRNPDRYRAASAFSPVVAPSYWSITATRTSSSPNSFAPSFWSAPARRRLSRCCCAVRKAMTTAIISYRHSWKIICAGTRRD